VIPVYGVLRGDTLVLLLPADEDDTMDALAGKLQDAADVRVARQAGASAAGRVIFRGRVVDRRTTVAAAGMEALDAFEVVPGEVTS